MPFLHFYSSSRPSITYPKYTLLRKEWRLNYIKIFILFCLPMNTALAGQIYSTNYDSGSLSDQDGFSWSHGQNTTISAEMSKSGSYSLKFTYPAGTEGEDSFSEQRFSLGGYYPDIWIKYDLYIPANYNHRDDVGSDNNKGFLHLWAGTYDGDNREGPLLGPNFWPTTEGSKIRMWVGSRINGVGQSVGHMSDDNAQSSTAIVANDKGHWMNIVIHAKYATISNDDGVYELWKTDWQGKVDKLIDIHDGPFYATKPNSTEPARGFAEGYLLGWANSGFDSDTVLHIDNFTVSTSPLSPLWNDIAPPKPPFVSQ